MPRAVVAPRSETDQRQFADDVAYYLTLTPRQLPSRYFYDELGSALFEAICRLPWYRITRLEQELLRVHATEIFAHLPGLRTLVELGQGSGEKLAALVEAGAHGPLTVHLIDVSAQAIDAATHRLADAHGLTVVAHQATYEAGLAEAARERSSGGSALVLFLGSNIGNFDPPGADALLSGVRAALSRGDALLLGTDLVKPEPELRLAYDDPLGVTAAFNRNLLVRANRELGADFDIDAFAHRAVWNREASRIEMQLVSARLQHVHVPAAHLTIPFHQDEIIWTESSYKFLAPTIPAMLTRAGFVAVDQWVSEGFALTLATAR